MPSRSTILAAAAGAAAALAAIVAAIHVWTKPWPNLWLDDDEDDYELTEDDSWWKA